MIGTFLTEKLLDEAYNLAKREGKKVIDKVLGNDELGKIVIKCINEVRKDDGLEKLTEPQEETLKEHAKEKLKVNIKYKEFKVYIGENIELPDILQKREEFLERIYVKYQYRIAEKLNLLMIDQDIQDIEKEMKKRKLVPLSLTPFMKSQFYCFVDFKVNQFLYDDILEDYFFEDGMIEYTQYEDENGGLHIVFNFDEPVDIQYVKDFLEQIDSIFIDNEIMVFEIMSHQ